MGLLKPDAPAAPDPQATIAAQTAGNKETAISNAALNRVNQVTPYGNSTYTTNGTDANGIPEYTQTTSLAPAQQQLLDQSNQGSIALGNTKLGMLDQVSNSYANPIDTSGAPGIASSAGRPMFNPQDYSAAQKQAQDAAYYKNTSYLDPQFEQGQKAMDNSLINQGITQGTEAYNNAQGNFGRTKQAAYDDARRSAISEGNQEQNTLYNQGAQTNQQQYSQGLSDANLRNSSNSQFLQQLFALRNQPLNEYNALNTGSQVTNPTFTSVPTASQANTDVAGITNDAYKNQLGAYNAAAASNPLNTIFGLGGSVLGAAGAAGGFGKLFG
jgi:hypothetical protein